MRKSNLGMLAVMWVGLTFAAEPRTVVMDVEEHDVPDLPPDDRKSTR
jgi:hypothetical protein